jgi:hypothetical protein
MASSKTPTGEAKPRTWSPEDDHKLIFTIIATVLDDCKVGGWAEITDKYNKMPGHQYSKRGIE